MIGSSSELVLASFSETNFVIMNQDLNLTPPRIPLPMSSQLKRNWTMKKQSKWPGQKRRRKKMKQKLLLKWQSCKLRSKLRKKLKRLSKRK